MKTISVLLALASTVFVADEAEAARPKRGIDWQQVHAEITYDRSGTIATAKEGHFDYHFEATIDQLMNRRAPDPAQKYASYVLPSGFERSFRLRGQVTVNGEATQVDETTKQTFHSAMALSGILQNEADLQLTEVSQAYPWEEGMAAKFDVVAPLKGTVETNLPLVLGLRAENYVTLWPVPAAFEDEAGFVSRGEYWLRPVLGPEPKEEFYKSVYLVSQAANAADEIPNQGGFKPPGVGVSVSGGADDWSLTFTKTVDVDTLTGGHYKETVKVLVKPVKKDLPEPKKKAEES